MLKYIRMEGPLNFMCSIGKKFFTKVGDKEFGLSVCLLLKYRPRYIYIVV